MSNEVTERFSLGQTGGSSCIRSQDTTDALKFRTEPLLRGCKSHPQICSTKFRCLTA